MLLLLTLLMHRVFQNVGLRQFQFGDFVRIWFLWNWLINKLPSFPTFRCLFQIYKFLKLHKEPIFDLNSNVKIIVVFFSRCFLVLRCCCCSAEICSQFVFSVRLNEWNFLSSLLVLSCIMFFGVREWVELSWLERMFPRIQMRATVVLSFDKERKLNVCACV